MTGTPVVAQAWNILSDHEDTKEELDRLTLRRSEFIKNFLSWRKNEVQQGKIPLYLKMGLTYIFPDRCYSAIS